MNKTNLLLDLSQVDQITDGDPNFKKELIAIFLEQIPEFISNMDDFLENNNLERLAREAHTAKSSVMIFGMQDTGMLLKEIELTAEEKKIGQIPSLLKQVETNLNEAQIQLNDLMQHL